MQNTYYEQFSIIGVNAGGSPEFAHGSQLDELPADIRSLLIEQLICEQSRLSPTSN